MVESTKRRGIIAVQRLRLKPKDTDEALRDDASSFTKEPNAKFKDGALPDEASSFTKAPKELNLKRKDEALRDESSSSTEDPNLKFKDGALRNKDKIKLPLTVLEVMEWTIVSDDEGESGRRI